MTPPTASGCARCWATSSRATPRSSAGSCTAATGGSPASTPQATAAVGQFHATLGGLLGAEGLADLMGGNALRFLGLLDDDGRPREGAAAARLRRFYGTAPLPAWLSRG
jgi:hypothetical protein